MRSFIEYFLRVYMKATTEETISINNAVLPKLSEAKINPTKNCKTTNTFDFLLKLLYFVMVKTVNDILNTMKYLKSVLFTIIFASLFIFKVNKKFDRKLAFTNWRSWRITIIKSTI